MTFLIEIAAVLIIGLVVSAIVCLASAPCAISVRRGSK
jgi:hypothetical protein